MHISAQLIVLALFLGSPGLLPAVYAGGDCDVFVTSFKSASDDELRNKIIHSYEKIVDVLSQEPDGKSLLLRLTETPFQFGPAPTTSLLNISKALGILQEHSKSTGLDFEETLKGIAKKKISIASEATEKLIRAKKTSSLATAIAKIPLPANSFSLSIKSKDHPVFLASFRKQQVATHFKTEFLYNLESQKNIEISKEENTEHAPSTDGKFVAIVRKNADAIDIYDMTTGTLSSTVSPHPNRTIMNKLFKSVKRPHEVALNQDGSKLLFLNDQLVLADAKAGVERVILPSFEKLYEPGSYIYGIDFLRDGRHALLRMMEPKGLVIVDLQTGDIVFQKIIEHLPQDVAVTDAGIIVKTTGETSEHLAVIHQTGSEFQMSDLALPHRGVSSEHVSQNASLFSFFSDVRRGLKINNFRFDGKSFEPLPEIDASTGQAWNAAVAVNREGTLIAVAKSSKPTCSLELYDVASGQFLGSIPVEQADHLEYLWFSSDSKKLFFKKSFKANMVTGSEDWVEVEIQQAIDVGI